jgi:hypothetical protein
VNRKGNPTLRESLQPAPQTEDKSSEVAKDDFGSTQSYSSFEPGYSPPPDGGTGKDSGHFKKDLLGLSPSQILGLQRTMGNRAIQRMVERTRLLKKTLPSSSLSPQNMASGISTTVNRATLDRPLQATRSRAAVGVVQRVREDEFVADPEDFMQKNLVLFEYGKGFQLRFPKTVTAAKDKLSETQLLSNLKTLMIANKASLPFYLQDTKNPDKGDKNVYFLTPAFDKLELDVLKTLFQKPDGDFVEDADTLAGIVKGETGEETGVITAAYAPYFIDNPNLKKDGTGAKDADSWENVGKTEVDPRVTNFVFTDSMNGCAYAITKAEGDDVKFEAWHFQSETDNFTEASHFRATKGIRDWFGVNDYYIGDGKFNSVATNIIWHKGGEEWKMLSQKNVIPLDGQGKAEFKESTSHDLNVSEPMSEERLDEVHDKLLTGAKRSIKESDVLKINQALQALAYKPALAATTRSLINPNSESMEKAEVNEINRISGRSGNDDFKRGFEADFTLFDDLAAFKAELTGITSVGRLWNSYDTAKTKPLKRRFDFEVVKVSDAIKTYVGDAKGTTITTAEGEKDSDMVLYNKLSNAQFFSDVWEDFAGYDKFKLAGDLLKSLITKKKGLLSKRETLAAEKEELFPSDS